MNRFLRPTRIVALAALTLGASALATPNEAEAQGRQGGWSGGHAQGGVRGRAVAPRMAYRGGVQRYAPRVYGARAVGYRNTYRYGYRRGYGGYYGGDYSGRSRRASASWASGSGSGPDILMAQATAMASTLARSTMLQ